MNSDQLVYRFLKAQLKSPERGDWVFTVEKDLVLLEMEFEIKDVENSDVGFKEVVKGKARAAALKYLNGMKEKHSKLKYLTYSDLKIRDYLKGNKFKEMAQMICGYRTRMADVKGNYKNGNESFMCPLCEQEDDYQEHLLVCTKIIEENLNIRNVSALYMDLFGEDVDKIRNVCGWLKEAMDIRNELLKKKDESE